MQMPRLLQDLKEQPPSQEEKVSEVICERGGHASPYPINGEVITRDLEYRCGKSIEEFKGTGEFQAPTTQSLDVPEIEIWTLST
jgi:hypothetical protein